MAFGTRVQFEAVRELAFGSIGATFSAIGTGLIDHGRIVSINNSTDVDLYISIDGSTNHLRIAANSFKLFDFSSDKIRDDGLFLAMGTVFYVKRVSGAPSTGTVWVEVAYAIGGV